MSVLSVCSGYISLWWRLPIWTAPSVKDIWGEFDAGLWHQTLVIFHDFVVSVLRLNKCKQYNFVELIVHEMTLSRGTLNLKLKHTPKGYWATLGLSSHVYLRTIKDSSTLEMTQILWCNFSSHFSKSCRSFHFWPFWPLTKSHDARFNRTSSSMGQILRLTFVARSKEVFTNALQPDVSKFSVQI